jgi:hypothetical protein
MQTIRENSTVMIATLRSPPKNARKSGSLGIVELVVADGSDNTAENTDKCILDLSEGSGSRLNSHDRGYDCLELSIVLIVR